MPLFSRRQLGFTLVEVLIASTLVGGIALILVKISTDAIQMQKRGEESFRGQDSVEFISKIFSNGAACKLNFQNKNLFDGNLDKVVNENNDPIFQVDQPVDSRSTDGKLILKSIKWDNINLVGIFTAIDGLLYNYGFIRPVFTFNYSKGASNNSSLSMSYGVTVMVTFSAADLTKIVDCYVNSVPFIASVDTTTVCQYGLRGFSLNPTTKILTPNCLPTAP
jgi:prepilin-type N-terminal cleavage/methylation domain-containing protein